MRPVVSNSGEPFWDFLKAFLDRPESFASETSKKTGWPQNLWDGPRTFLFIKVQGTHRTFSGALSNTAAVATTTEQHHDRRMWCLRVGKRLTESQASEAAAAAEREGMCTRTAFAQPGSMLSCSSPLPAAGCVQTANCAQLHSCRQPC